MAGTGAYGDGSKKNETQSLTLESFQSRGKVWGEVKEAEWKGEQAEGELKYTNHRIQVQSILEDRQELQIQEPAKKEDIREW